MQPNRKALYYMLTGRPPLAGDLGEVLRAVQRGEFHPPRKVNATIDPALEAVCLKAMAHKPGDRYASPRGLAEDLERWMADEPVSAWREPWSRRARRWQRRHRTAVTAATAAVLVALAGTGAVLAVQTRANADLQAANAELATANQKVNRANVELKSANEREHQRFELAMEAIKLFHGEVSEDLLLKEKQFAEAMAILRREVARGYRPGDYLQVEPGLISLRSRDDFRLMTMDQAFPAEPIAVRVDKEFRPVPDP